MTALCHLEHYTIEHHIGAHLCRKDRAVDVARTTDMDDEDEKRVATIIEPGNSPGET